MNPPYREADVASGVRTILYALGVDFADPNFKGTPERVARAYKEMCRGLWANKEIEELFTKTFPSTYDQMIVARDISAVGLCPHHLLPVEYTIHVAYIPNGEGNVIGISKLARLAKLLAARPVLQEQLTEDIAEQLQSNLAPDGVGVIVIGKHSCMGLRGVRDSRASIVTSIMLGAMRDYSDTRAEFMKMVRIK